MLTGLLGNERVTLGAWSRDAVDYELQVAIDEFIVTSTGQVDLQARWRINAPGAARAWKTGESRIEKQGPAPVTDMAGAIATMSNALGDLSRELAGVVGELK